jgi:hypothetical protein
MPHAANSEDGASVLILVATSLRRLINNLQNEHGGPRHSFQVIDIVEGPIPVADLWLCREVLFHLSNRDVLKVLDLFGNSNVKHILTTIFDFVQEIETSEWAALGGF